MGCIGRAAQALCAAIALVGVPAHAQPRPSALTLRIVGGLQGVNQYTRHEEPFGSQELTRLSAGSMVLVNTSAADEKLGKTALESTVLPRWLQRCGETCADTWNSTIGPVQGALAPTAVGK